MIKIISYGSGNVKAIWNIFDKLNIPCEIAENENDLAGASKLILPGVGAFDEAMRLFENSKMLQTASEMVTIQQVPVLGVCVGMQMMARSSEEGRLDGLGWVDANVRRMDTSRLISKPLLPHMGWNSVSKAKDHRVIEGIDMEKGFYFLHSFHICCSNADDVLTTSSYGQSFTSSFVSRNVFGFQFHPEKSHRNGIQLFKNFAEL